MLARADFHIHSTASDGSLTPTEIVITARKLGIDIIAITDHNSTGGIMEAAAAGRQYGVSVIPAVEISTKYGDESIHILGYFRDGRFNDITFQEVLKSIREHKAGRARNILSNYMAAESYGDHLSLIEGMNLLSIFGAAVVLAHPVRISKKHLVDILNLPFDGIEAKYCRNSQYDTCFFVNTALSRFSFYTGGSDFHTDRRGDHKHCFIGDPYIGPNEIQTFLSNSRAAVLS